MSTILNPENKQRIIELYLCSNDRRLKVIAETIGCSSVSVSSVLQEYYDGLIEFERGNYKILHSSINGFD